MTLKQIRSAVDTEDDAYYVTSLGYYVISSDLLDRPANIQYQEDFINILNNNKKGRKNIMTKQILINGVNGSQAIFSHNNWEVTGSIPLSNSIINGYGYRAKFDFNDLKHIPLDTPILGYQIANEDAEQQYTHIENDNLETVADLMMTTKQAIKEIYRNATNKETQLLATKNLNSPDTIIAIAEVMWDLIINNQEFTTLAVIDDLANDFFETIDDPACYTVLKRN